MCENVPHVYREPGESLEEYANRTRGPMLFPCRQCEECADAAEGIICGDIVAERQTAAKALVLLLTYADEKLIEAGRDVASFLQDIPEAAKDRRRFIYEFRKQLRRMNEALQITIKQKPVTEIATIAGDDGKAPRVGTPPRVHHHLVLFFDLAWKDADRQSREPARWEDMSFPRFRLDWLYNHVLETKAEAKARGGRIRKTATPWPWGFMGYEIPRGGEGRYIAKYCSKCMRLRAKIVAEGVGNLSPEQLIDYERAEASKKTMRGSPGIGYRFYRRQAQLAAQQGLPPSLYFEPALGEIHLEDGTYVRGPFMRSVTVPSGELALGPDMRLAQQFVRRKVRPRFMLQRVGRQRCYIEAYDAEWARLHGEAAQPVGSTVRQIRTAGGKTKSVIVYGMAEAREAVAKDDDRRYLAKRERELAKRRKLARRRYGGEMSQLETAELYSAECWRAEAKLSNEHANGSCTPRATGEGGKRTFVNFWSVLRAWEDTFEREVLRKLGFGVVRTPEIEREKYRDLYYWLRGQMALSQWPDAEVKKLAREMRRRWRLKGERQPRHWPIWRKGKIKAGVICG